MQEGQWREVLHCKKKLKKRREKPGYFFRTVNLTHYISSRHMFYIQQLYHTCFFVLCIHLNTPKGVEVEPGGGYFLQCAREGLESSRRAESQTEACVLHD